MNKGLISFEVYAEAYYSGAIYSELVYITLEDYRKYFCDNQNISVEDIIAKAKVDWHGREICLGELDGKHSEVCDEIHVDFWNTEDIKSSYNEPENTGTLLTDDLINKLNISDYNEKRKLIKDLQNNVNELVKSVGKYIKVTYRIPEDKLNELNKFVEELLKEDN